jgi:site-specific recombinase XerD
MTGLNDGITDSTYRVVFHTLRHTFASHLVIAGVDLYRVQKLMRHKTAAMTQKYAHLRPQHTVDSVEKLFPNVFDGLDSLYDDIDY